jgi:hypothetical protein
MIGPDERFQLRRMRVVSLGTGGFGGRARIVMTAPEYQSLLYKF